MTNWLAPQDKIMIYQANNPLLDCEIKFANNDKGEFEGYGSSFNGVDGKGDTILKGTYEESLSKFMPKMFINHGHNEIPVGDWLKASEDSSGLFLAGKIDLNHREGKSLHSAMKRKAMEGLSIGAPMSSVVFEKNREGGRIISKMKLVEVSVVTFPMDSSAQIMTVKSEIEDLKTLKDFELFLRDSGSFSKSAATAFVSRINKLKQSDSVADDEIAELKARVIRENTQRLIDAIENK